VPDTREVKLPSKDHGIEELLKFALEVIHSAGMEALTFYGKGKFNIKFDEALVTESELHLMEFFQEQLGRKFPEHIIFEGNQDLNDYTHEGKRYLWVYDALDGVANFQAGIPVWGMSLGLMDNFWPLFGIFYLPSTGDIFYAMAGREAYWGSVKINVLKQDAINDESVLLTYSRFHQHYRSTFPGKIRSLGCTAAHICYVAMGRADAAIIAHETYQDLAAASVIVEAAGGKIYRMDGSEFMLNDYLNGEKIDEHLLVVAPEASQQILDYIQKNN